VAVVRQNPFLDEYIQILDMHRARYDSSYRGEEEARATLSREDNEFIDGEWVHCMTDTRYFLSNYYFYRDEAVGFKGLYPFFDSQEILHDELRKLEKQYGKVKAVVNKARQMGYTVYMVGEFFHKTIFYEHTNAIMVSQDEKGAKYNMGMYESAFDFLPWWLKPRVNLHQTGALYNFDEPDEELRKRRPGLKTSVYADNANRPSGVGRGQTYRRALLDELAFWNNAKQLSRSLLRACNSEDGFYVMGSTANGRNDTWHNWWRKAEAGSIDWHPIFIPFYRRPKTYSIPIPKGQVFVLNEDETMMREAVLKKDKYLIPDEVFNWMRKTKEEFIDDEAGFAQEYTDTPEASFQSSSTTAFPRRIINKHAKYTSTINPKWVGEIGYDFIEHRPKLHMRDVADSDRVPYPETDDRFHIFEKPQKGYEYAMGIDVALGNPGGDYSVVQVIKKPKFIEECDEQVAVWHGLINPTALAEVVFAIGWYYNEALAAVEVNSYGMQTNSVLLRNYEYDNIYRYKRLDHLRAVTNIVGFYSTPSSCDAIMARMSEAFLEDTIIINDRFTVDEFYDYTEEGATGEGAHDDLVDALQIALYCAHEAEVRDRQEGTKKPKEGQNQFAVIEPSGKVIYEGTSQGEAQRMAKRTIGAQIIRKAGARANLQIGNKQVRIPSDFANTDFSPIHDKEGTAKRLYEDGVPAEEIDSEMIAMYDEEADEEVEGDSNSWLSY